MKTNEKLFVKVLLSLFILFGMIGGAVELSTTSDEIKLACYLAIVIVFTLLLIILYLYCSYRDEESHNNGLYHFIEALQRDISKKDEKLNDIRRRLEASHERTEALLEIIPSGIAIAFINKHNAVVDQAEAASKVLDKDDKN